MSAPKPGCVESEGRRGSVGSHVLFSFPTGFCVGYHYLLLRTSEPFHEPSPTSLPLVWGGADVPATGRSKNQTNKTLPVYSPTGVMESTPFHIDQLKQSPYLIPTFPLHNHHPRGSYFSPLLAMFLWGDFGKRN